MKSGKLVYAVTVVAALAINGFAASQKPSAQGKDRTLTAGKYTATTKAFVCGGCGPLIQETLQKNPSIEAVSIDDKGPSVQFTVKKGTKVRLSELQKALKGAADNMGMGADYRLKDVKKAGS